MKSCAVPDGAGGTSEASRLGQEAALCSEDGVQGQEVTYSS